MSLGCPEERVGSWGFFSNSSPGRRLEPSDTHSQVPSLNLRSRLSQSQRLRVPGPPDPASWEHSARFVSPWISALASQTVRSRTPDFKARFRFFKCYAEEPLMPTRMGLTFPACPPWRRDSSHGRWIGESLSCQPRVSVCLSVRSPASGPPLRNAPEAVISSPSSPGTLLMQRWGT